MITQRQLFFQHLAQTSGTPLQLEIEKAEGVCLYDNNGKAYIDLISGVSVSNVGHRHPEVIKAVTSQLDKYMHLMVYGEYIQSPQVKLAKLLTDNLPPSLDCVYFVNSGSEAIEGALKLAKRYNGKHELISFRNAYHGSTHGALSILGDERMKNSFRPLLPEVRLLSYNNVNDLTQITSKTACVVVEAIQAEAGVVLPADDFLKKLRARCDQVGACLIFDEVQTGFGRTGELFAFMHYNIVPDILVLAKGMGGGMPIGAFVAGKEMMDSFKTNPVLGHITTFGGHPVSCAAALASLEVLLKEDFIDNVARKEQLFRSLLRNKKIKNITGKGLLLSVELTKPACTSEVMKIAVDKGVILGDYLFNNNCFSVNPPLTISDEEIKTACGIIIESIDSVY